MRYLTTVLRALLVVLSLGLILACLLLYVVSLDLAAEFPGVGYLRLPVFIAVMVGLAPVVVVIHAIWSFFALADRGEAFSPATVVLLGRVRNCFAIMSVYLFLSFLLLSSPLGSPAFFLTWLGGQVVLAFLFFFVLLLERLAHAAVGRQLDTDVIV